MTDSPTRWKVVTNNSDNATSKKTSFELARATFGIIMISVLELTSV